MTQPTEQDRAEYSQGVCMDGAAILRDGAMMTVDDIVGTLNALQARVAELEKREAAYDIILKVVSSALERAGVTECDNPADAIEMIAQERDGLAAKLADAAASLNTISIQAGKEPFMQSMVEVRSYARSRAMCAGYVNQIEREGGV